MPVLRLGIHCIWVLGSKRTVNALKKLNRPNHCSKSRVYDNPNTETYSLRQRLLPERFFCSPIPYHDKEWAAKIKAVGLQPSSTGAPGGKETGQHVSHYIIAGGVFAVAFAKLQASGFTFRWQSRTDDPQRKAKTASKTKYTCPECEQTAWAKPGAKLICGVCHEEDGAIRPMEAEE
jgi:hypothetical protein